MDINKKKKKEHLREKVCQFPRCETIFYGTGASKYCVEHRKRSYRKVIDGNKKSEIEKYTNNQVIKQGFCETQDIEMQCGLEGCVNKFTFKVFPSVYIYPKYCEEHRNEYKRKRFLQLNGISIFQEADNIQ